MKRPSPEFVFTRLWVQIWAATSGLQVQILKKNLWGVFEVRRVMLSSESLLLCCERLSTYGDSQGARKIHQKVCDRDGRCVANKHQMEGVC